MEIKLDDVSKSPEPLLFRQLLKWNILEWDARRWRSFFESGQRTLQIRRGPLICSKEPLWERTCSLLEIKTEEFFDIFQSQFPSRDGWLYFDYKHIANHLTPEMTSKLDFTWEAVGHPEKSAKDSTLWMGTAGAHTPCHVDTYGCNFVAQIYGKKRWILFPPTETCNLKPVRVPYEESSIYSSYNFYRGCSSFPAVKEAIVVDLEPGDVLFVPNGWWHYVENLTSAISINIWIPQDSDNISRIKECFVKFLVHSASIDMDSAQVAQILNPNEDDLRTIPRHVIMAELQWCLEHAPSVNSSKAADPIPNQENPLKNHTLARTAIADIKSKQASPHDCTISSSSPGFEQIEFNLIKAFCHPDVINLVLDKFLEMNSAASVK